MDSHVFTPADCVLPDAATVLSPDFTNRKLSKEFTRLSCDKNNKGLETQSACYENMEDQKEFPEKNDTI